METQTTNKTEQELEQERAAQKARADEYVKNHNYGEVEIPEINGTAGLPATGIQKTVTPKEKTNPLNWIKDKWGNFVNNQTQKAVANAAPSQVDWTKAGETLQEADQKGLQANRAIQNSEIPKWKRMTINDILFNPEYEGIRDSIAGQAVRARGANFLKGLAGKDASYTSAIDQYNNLQDQRYREAVADRDRRALEAQLQADEAANKRDVGATLQVADTKLGRELDRWGLLYDTETKKQVLTQMIKDSKEFDRLVPDPQDRLLLTAYQQYLSGDATALDSLVSTYGTDIVEKLDGLIKTIGNYFGGDSNVEYPDIMIGGTPYTAAQIENLGWEGIDDLIKDMPYEDQIDVYNDLAKNYDLKDREKRNLKNAIETRNKNASLTEQALENKKNETDTRADEVSKTISEILNNGKYDEKKKRDKLKDLQSDLERAEGSGDFVDTEKMQSVRANLKAEIAKAELATEVTSINSPLQANVKLKLSDGKLDTKAANSSLSYLAGLNWWTLINKNTQSVTKADDKLGAVMGTNGYKDVVNFLSNSKVRDYVLSNDDAAKNYKYAVNKFVEVFGGSPKDYGFLNVTW